MIKIKKGLDLPIQGSPEQVIGDGAAISKVALIADDYVGMKPSMEVSVGDKVKKGQLLFSDKKTEGVLYTAPASGEVIEVNRGDKRAFQSLVIKVEGNDSASFNSYKSANIADYSKDEIESLLIESGQWTALRVRPFSKVAAPGTTPSSIFVTAMDTNPLSANPDVIIEQNKEAFELGLKVLTKMAKVNLCQSNDSKLVFNIDSVTSHTFSGPHPAGLVGTHIHFIDPVGEKKSVWHIGYQDVIAYGKLIQTGEIFSERIVSVAGPIARNARLIKTVAGACLNELVAGETLEVDSYRTVSGSVLGGRNAQGPFAYLGKYHNQVSLLREGADREFMGWHSPGFDRFSVKNIYISKLFGSKKFGFTTNGNGSLRAVVPVGSYEKVMPLDIEPTFLMRSLMSGNLEMSAKLGALELDEEDLALCNFVDPGKNDFALKLRQTLTTIEKEG